MKTSHKSDELKKKKKKGGVHKSGTYAADVHHSHTLSWFWANQSLLFFLNPMCLTEKQQIPDK
jgi:hypothetical protein